MRTRREEAKKKVKGSRDDGESGHKQKEREVRGERRTRRKTKDENRSRKKEVRRYG